MGSRMNKIKIERFEKEFDDIIEPGAEIEIIQDGLIFTEGPVWNSKLNALLFSDIPANKIYIWSEKDGLKIFRENSHFSNGLTFTAEGDLIACEQQSRSVTRTDKYGNVYAVATHYQGKKLNSPKRCSRLARSISSSRIFFKIFFLTAFFERQIHSLSFGKLCRLINS